jgi:polyisoprenoid-binding protein YceI
MTTTSRIARLFTLGAFLAASTLAISPRTASAQDYVIDAAHSSVNFTVRHMLSKVRGKFNTFEGEFTYDPTNIKASKANLVIDANSIDTGHEKRDPHLRSDDFFDVEKFKTLTFVSTKVEAVGTGLKIYGDITIRGVTKPIVFDAVYLGEGTDPWGNKKVAFEATSKLNRKDFGLNWNKALEAGGVMVGDDIDLEVMIAAAPKPKAEPTKVKGKK